MTGNTVSHYKILDKLGEGGMGEVYLAEDKKLRRKAVLKFIQPKLTSDKNVRERFEREAQAAAALNHPNIVTIYEIEQHEGQTFIAMEHVEGLALREEIANGPMEIDRIVAIAQQVCAGLGEAHEAGIVHRDIKPENIIVSSSGRVKILDFGLARMKGITKLTKDASTLGTLKYMSPEQYQNKKVDHRTDIWSLGVVLFEMLTGRLPFEGDYEAAVMYAVVNEEPKSAHTLRQDIPEKYEKIVSKCLEKNPENRYQSMQEVLEELKKSIPSRSISEKKEKSIVVLPFEDISPGRDNEYFSDGLTEEIITDLSHIHDLLVISRSSAMTFKGTKKTIPEIARAVNVRYVLEGSVRKVGNNLRITAQLIDAANDVHLWAEKYSGTLDDVFDIQEKVSRSIVDEIQLHLTPEEEARIRERKIENIEAYEYYLRARREIYKLTREGLDNALRYLNKGLDIVGENVLLYACMGNVYFQYWNYGVWPDKHNIQKAEECAQRVFELEPDSKHGHFLLGLMQTFINPPQALLHFERVLSEDPYHSETLLWLSIYVVFQGKQTVAEKLLERLTKVDPLNTIVKILPGNLHFYCGRWELAVENLKKVYDSDPEHFIAQFHYAKALAYTNRLEEAYVITDNLVNKMPEDMRVHFFRLYKFAFQGKKSDVLKSVNKEILNWARRDWMICLWLSEIFSLVHESDDAFNWLRQAVNLGFINYPFLNEYNPFLIEIRKEVRFQKLMEEIKPKWESFKL